MTQTHTAPHAPWEIYAQEHLPKSNGRVILADLLATYTGLQYGIGHQHIAMALTGTPEDAKDADFVTRAARLLGSILVVGKIASFARPFGGGPMTELPKEVWEIDDVVHRFATCSLDPARPFDAAATPTHWIFVEDAAVQLVFDACCEDVRRDGRGKGPRIIRNSGPTDSNRADLSLTPDERLIRMPELERVVGMSRPTIYERIRKGRFPEPIKNGSRLSSWLRSEVQDWIAAQR